MRKQLVVAALVVVVLVAGVTTGTALVARAIANTLSARGNDSQPIVSDPSEAASTAGGAASSSPASYTPSFIVHKLQPGEPLITDAQINDYYLAQSSMITGDLANTMLAIHEGQIEVRCMADKGWWYDPRYTGGLDSNTPEGLALNGNTGAGDAYRWQDAGCYGLAVHETGATN